MRRAIFACVVALALVAQSGTARAAWTATGSGSAAAKAKTMPAGNTPTASVSNRNVTVNWTESTFSGGTPVGGYVVKRYNTGGQAQTVGSGCSGTISALTCTEQAVPSGDWKYSVTPKQGNWTGQESAQSTAVTVASPTLSISSPTTVTSLPTTLNGNVANFIPGQALTFRLDDPNTGTTLSSTMSPSSIPSNGSATITVTIPSGTSNGSHTVYAVGGQGDVASVQITVSVPTARSLTIPAWDVSDVSSGTAINTSDPFATAGGPYHTSIGFQSAFDTNRYLAFDFNDPLRAGFSTSGVNFNFNFLGTDSAFSATTTCFYFEVRRKSTGTVLGTHGSASTPVACSSGLTFVSTTTAIPEVSTTDIANDLQVRVYLKNAAAGYNITDLATVSGSEGSTAFTLYDKQYVNAASGTPSTTPWSLGVSGDGSEYTSDAGWDNAFSTSKYVKLTFPAYIPAGATAIGATFRHAYKSDTSGATSCYYFEVYSGATLIGTHGSSSTPVSCNASSTTYVTDTVSLPEVDTVSEANNVVIRIYAKNNYANPANKRRTNHDLATVALNYTG
jgi:hypothetical protein